MMDSGAVSHAVENDEGSYPPLSFYMGPAVNYRGPVLKGNKSSESNKCTPLSLYTTILVSRPAPPGPMGESKMDIFVENEVNFARRYHPLSFYTDPIHRGRLRMTYIHPLSSKASTAAAFSNSSSQSKVTAAVSNSSSQSKVSFPCFASQSSQSKSVANIVFGTFGSKSAAKVSKNYIPLSIPDKVAFSILSKLPIKSLKRFGCARKSWSILFENTDFMTMYTKHFISPRGSDDDDDDYHTFILANHHHPDGLYHSEFHLVGSQIKLNLPSPLQPSREGTYILGSTSVNGIFCLGQKFPPIQKSLYVMWNPVTQEFMVVPPSPAELVPKPPVECIMEHVFHGFGYDKLRDDFKVIQFISFDYFCDRPTSFIEIYSLKSNSWRLIHMEKDLRRDEHGYYTARSFKGLEVYLDGACHWLVFRSVNRKKAMSLLSFDLSDEVFLTTPIGLEHFSPYTALQRLTVLNGSIALISNYHDDVVFHISILGELGVNESWIKLYIYGPLPSVQWPPIGFGKMGYIFITKKDYEVAYVDLSTQIIEEVGITCRETSELNGGLYKESLLSIGVSSN